ncbi:LytR/AlgR family response regulator transcription factor [Pseudoduganella namucuonensis]|uniref:Two component transcriptional regulator, LytTR family n=1 Tax=Pseudoduganella namucuonensis TaxID=1035707 RepID=A0A1I7H918_9BURK|nr:LytTR family DNA-binding domain-containing protein [Pseudoduganella namucuonensis]SFU57211.1 two component transcriptional regulator, LytTR family [Pseudoduganella namucuonensis]
MRGGPAPRVLIADDEPLLRAELREALRQLWPEAAVVAEAADGYEALRLARACEPDVAFLDIRMPGLNGLEVARAFAARAHVVFVTAHQEHAVAAFDEGAVDYVLKPLEASRVARCVERLRGRLSLPPPDLTRLMERLQAAPAAPSAPAWLQASVGATIHFIDLADVVYFSAEAKYVRVVTDKLEAHIRTPLKELAETLDSAGFWQIHRGHVVAVKRIAAASRDADGALWLTLRGHAARLPVSQRFQHRFKGM